MENVYTSFFLHFSETHRILTYTIVFLIVFFIEGEITLVLAGLLTRKHLLDFGDLLTIGIIAAILHDILYWAIGRMLIEKKSTHFLFIHLEKMGKFIEQVHKRYRLYIFVSKLAWGLNKPVLVSVGYLKIKLRQLLTYSIPACIIWVASLVSLGHVFADETHLLRKDLKTAGLLVAGFIITLLLVEYGVKRFLKKPD